MILRVLLVVTAALNLAACAGSSEVAAPPRETVTVTVTEPAPPSPDYSYENEEPVAADAATTATFDGEYFSVEYPDTWRVEAAEVSKGSYIDTTIRDASNPEVMLRIDVSPGSFSTPAAMASEVEAYLVDQPGYRRLRFEQTAFNGHDAFRWDFIVEEDGVRLRKSDIFLATAEGDGVAILIQASAREYGLRLAELTAARDSLALVAHDSDEGYDSYSGSDVLDSSEFCETHDCIDNFEEGRGSVVQCADGTWSQSGGIQGACSHHGGVIGGSGSSGSYGDVDDNGDGSTHNWCGASRDGDGDGLWCEGR